MNSLLPTLKELLPETFISCKHMVSSLVKMWLQGREIAPGRSKNSCDFSACCVWKHKGISDALISSLWFPPGDQEGGKHNDKQSQEGQAHCNGSYFAVSISKTFFFWKEKENRECYSRTPYSYTVLLYSRKVGKYKPEVLKTLLSFVFSFFFLSYTYYTFYLWWALSQ